jgi:hypothetical protein
MRATVLFRAGFPLAANLPGLIWSEVLLWAVGLVPFAAVAAVVPGITSLVLAVLLFVVASIISPMHPANESIGTALGSLGWIRDSVAAVAVAALAGLVLRAQYRHRATAFSRALLIGGGAAILAGYLFFPWPAAFAIQQAVGSRKYDHLPLQFVPAGGARPFARQRDQIGVGIGLRIAGIPADMRAQIDSLRVDLNWPDGRHWTTDQPDLIRLEPQIDDPSHFMGTFRIERSFLNADPVAFHGTIYLTLLGNPQSRTVLLGSQPSLATPGLECMKSEIVSSEVYCRSPFRWPRGMVTASFGGADVRPVGHELSWSPFPADLDPNPSPIHGSSVYGSAPAETLEMTVAVYQPLAHLKREFVWNGMKISDRELEPSQAVSAQR